MTKLSKYLKSILLSPMWILMGGGGGDKPDINATTTSQTALWGQYAKDWNTYIKDVEPRVENAYKQSLVSPESRITSEIKGKVLSGYNPQATLLNKAPLGTNMIRSQSNLGGALAGAGVRGTEIARDYQSNTLGNIIASKMGAKTGTQGALGSVASGEANNFMQDLASNDKINTMMGQAASSALGSTAMGAYTGATNRPMFNTSNGVQ